MSTAATGGQPTTRLNAYGFSGAPVNVDFYTCPTNTFTEVFLERLEISGGFSGSYQIGIGSPTAYSGTARIALVTEAAAFSGIRRLPPLIDWSTGAGLDQVGRASDPVYDSTTNKIYSGRFFIYPGETLYVVVNSGSFTAATIRYSTVEVTAGS